MRDIGVEMINTLMLIDDSSFDQMVYKRICDKSGLVQTLVQFLDPMEAFAYLDDPNMRQPDLILLDINMPGMDGFEFLEFATEKYGVEMCPIVVMITTSLNPKDADRAKDFEVVRDFLNKPLTYDQLFKMCEMVEKAVG